jgi:hypothetical protein
MGIDTIMAEQLLKRSKKTKKIGGSAKTLGREVIKGANRDGGVGLGMVAAGMAGMAGGIGNALYGNLPMALASGVAGRSLFASGMKRLDRSVGNAQTGAMIARQGDNVAKSPRMAETLSMASMKTGVRGPQSSGNAMPAGYDQQSFQQENSRLGYSAAQEFRRLDAMDSNGDAMTQQQTSRHGSLHSRMSETASAFAAANAKFAGSRGSTASKQAKGTRADQPKSDGYVEAHTRRQGTKAVQIKQRRMTAAEKTRSR